MYKDWIEILKNCSLFAGIEPEGLNTMLQCLRPVMKRYRHREVVVAYGSPFQGVGILAEGQVALSRETYSGNRVIIDILKPTDMFGEMVAFSGGTTWPLTIIAQEDSCLFFLPGDKILGNCPNVCPAHRVLIMNVLKIISDKALAMNRHLDHLSARTIRGKISSYLMEEYRRNGNAALDLPLRRNELADYLNIPRPSLSREMGRMQNDGLIEYLGSWVELKDLPALERFSE